MTLAELNACDRARFVATLGWIFEDSPWVADRTWQHRPFASREHLLGAMTAEVANATAAEQLALLQAHPDLGTRARMSDASSVEQSAAGLDRLTPEAFARLHRLTAAYRQKFGYPFLLAVKHSTPEQILDALDRRLLNDPVEEFAEALRQVYRIAQARLDDTIR